MSDLMPPTPVIPAGIGKVRGEVRAFLDEERRAGRFRWSRSPRRFRSDG